MKKNNKSKFWRNHTALCVVLAIAILVVIVPVLINESYSLRFICYRTHWGAADVLSYYGTVLGAFIACTSLIVTIRFTRNQIERESYIRIETEKWKAAEQVIDQALFDISPLNMAYDINYSEHLAENVIETINKELKYTMKAKASLDGIKIYLNPEDFRQVEELVNKIWAAIEEYCSIADEIAAPYSELLSLLLDNTNASIEFQKTQQEILSKTNEPYSKIVVAHDGSYQNLLNLKRDTFSQIYKSLYDEANKKLYIYLGSTSVCPQGRKSDT